METLAALENTGQHSEDQGFSAAIAALSSAFGDPSRRAIFLYIRSNPHCTVAELADEFALHPNVVRHPLDRLLGGSYIEAEAPERSHNAGRPAKRYSCVATDLVFDLGTRQDDLILALLEKALERLGTDQSEAIASQVGHDFGFDLAQRMGPVDGQRTIQAAMATVAQTMTAHGFAARAEGTTHPSVVVEHCPFGEVAAHNPVLCAVDKGMVTGLLAGLGVAQQSTEVQLTSRARGDQACRATA